MALYLLIVKTITIAKLAHLFLNKVVYYFRTPRGIISNYSSIFTSSSITFPAPTSPYGQKDISACELVASAAGPNICTLMSSLKEN